MLFGGFLLHKTNQKAWHRVSCYAKSSCSAPTLRGHAAAQLDRSELAELPGLHRRGQRPGMAAEDRNGLKKRKHREHIPKRFENQKVKPNTKEKRETFCKCLIFWSVFCFFECLKFRKQKVESLLVTQLAPQNPLLVPAPRPGELDGLGDGRNRQEHQLSLG